MLTAKTCQFRFVLIDLELAVTLDVAVDLHRKTLSISRGKRCLVVKN